MANTKLQVKRSNVTGRQPNTTSSGNSQYISAGELALNMTDQKLFTSDGTNLITVGANQTNLNVTGNLTVKSIIANGTIGSDGQLLASNGSTTYWTSATGTGSVTSVASGNGLSGGPITTSGTLSVVANDGIVSNSSGVFVKSGPTTVVNATGVHVNTDYAITWSNTHTFNANINANNVSISGNISTVDSIYFSNAVLTATEGVLTWNSDDSTLDLGLAGNTSILQLGQEVLYRVKNQTGSTINNGVLVMANGTLGASGRILITPAVANGSYPSQYIMGIATENITTGSDGYVTHFGKVRGIDTSMWANGDILYADPANTGGLTNVKPSAPNNKTIVAIVISSHASTGTLFVRPTYGSSLFDDEKAEITSIANNDLLIWKTANNRFENVNQSVLNVNTALTANNSAYLDGTAAASYQLNSTLAANVATLTANNTSYVGSVTAANVVSNAQLSSNLANYTTTTALTNNLANYQTTAGLASNVATLTSNNTSYVGSVTAANVVSNAQLSSNLANYQTTAGLASNVATLTSNNSNYLGGTAAASYQLNSTLAANVATMTANNTSYVGSVTAANVVSNAQLSGNLANYAALSGATFTGAVSVSNNLTVTGNLVVTGTTVTMNVTTLDVKDLNITLAKGAATNAATDTAGITVDTSNIGWYYNYASNTWQSNVGITPSANLSFSLGSSTLQWSNVYANNIVGANIYGTLQTASQPNITANNTNYVGSVTAANVVSNAQLSGNLANYQTTAGLSANVATLTSNNANYLGGTAAASYQLNSTLAANVATMTANNTSYVGSVTAANVVSNAQLSSNLANYQTTAGLSANVATLTANNANYLGGTAAASYQLNSTLAANVATLSSNNSSYLGGVAAASYVNTSGAYTISGVHTYSANVIVNGTLGINSVIALVGANGSAGQVLTSNGNSNAYWSTPTTGTVTSVASGNGITGGIITSTGTLYATAGVGMVVNTSGINVLANNGIVANSTGTFVNPNNGISVNSSGVFVKAGNSQLISNSTGVWVDQTQIDHNSLSNYVANKHVDHTAVSIATANGIAGGGDISATRNLYVSAGVGLNSNSTGVQVVANNGIVANSTGTWAKAANGISVDSSGINVLAGNSQLVSNATGVWVAQAQIDHNSLSNFVANKHIDHSGVSISTANGIAGGGDITTTRNLYVVANTGIVSNSSGVFTDQTSLTTATINANLSGSYANLTGQVNAASIYVTTSANVASAVYANSSGLYTTGTINAASYTIGTAFTANSTVVNAVSYYAGTTLIGNTTGPYGKTEGSLSVNNAAYLGGTAAASYQLNSTLSANVATLTANNTSYVGSVTAANVVSNAQLSGNLANYAALAGATFTGAVNVSNNVTVTGNLVVTGTTVTMNVTTLDVKDLNITVAKGAATNAATDGAGITVDTANIGFYYNYASNTWQSNVGITPSANLSFNLGSSTLQWSNVYANNIVGANIYGTLQTASQPNITANNANYLGGTAAASYQLNSTLSANVATLSSNNSSYLGGVAAASYVNTSGAYTISGVHTYSANIISNGTLGVNSVIALVGSNGTAGQVITSNGNSNAYWSTPTTGTVTSVASGNGISGGTITGSGTLYAKGANGITVDTNGINVTAGNNQLVSNSTGVWVSQGNIDHNSLSNFVANKHIDHTAVSIATANGIAGGGDISTTRNLYVSAGVGLNSNSTGVQVVANNGITANSTGTFVTQGVGTVVNSSGVNVLANNGIVSNSTGVFVNGNTGIVSNSSGVFTNQTSLTTATINANLSASYANVSGQVNTATLYVTTSANVASVVQANSSGLFSTQVVNAASLYSTTNTTTIGTAAYFVSNGNVGIGTSTPSSKLHVNGNFSIAAAGIQYMYNSDNSSYYYFYNAGPSGNSILSIQQYGLGERMRLDASGNVGIGNTAPAYKLHVQGDSYVTGNVCIGVANTTAYNLYVNGSFAATTKSFVIDHPSKPEMKLRYASLEGPENGVYVRGRLTGKTFIDFPDYWRDLVDIDSVTVQLTPIGKAKQPSVGNITQAGVNIIGKNVDCFYFIQAERKDVEKLVVEF